MNVANIALVRAFGGEPFRVAVKPETDGSIWVFRDSPEAAIPYQWRFVFEFEDELFGKLRAAYSRADKAALAALWERARPLTRKTIN